MRIGQTSCQSVNRAVVRRSHHPQCAGGAGANISHRVIEQSCHSWSCTRGRTAYCTECFSGATSDDGIPIPQRHTQCRNCRRTDLSERDRRTIAGVNLGAAVAVGIASDDLDILIGQQADQSGYGTSCLRSKSCQLVSRATTMTARKRPAQLDQCCDDFFMMC